MALKPTRPTRTSSRSIAAGALASFVSCEMRHELDHRYGEQVSPERQQRRDEGDRVHLAVHRDAIEHHNSHPRLRKGPCFIASAVFGPDHPDTWALRAFRDMALRPSWAGRQAIAIYYRLSPPIARWLPGHPRITALVRRALEYTITFIPKEGKHTAWTSK